MSSMQDDGNGEDLTGLDKDPDSQVVYLEEVKDEIEGILAGMQSELEDPTTPKDTAMLATDLGQVTQSYLRLWLMNLDSAKCHLEEKTTLGELLLYFANVQAEMDLMAQGEKVQ